MLYGAVPEEYRKGAITGPLASIGRMAGNIFTDPLTYTPAILTKAAAVRLAADLGAAAIVAATSSGSTAAAVSPGHPAAPVIALTHLPATARRLALLWGVIPRLADPYVDLDDMSAKAVEAARALGLAGPGATLVCTAGLPFGRGRGTDLIRVVRT